MSDSKSDPKPDPKSKKLWQFDPGKLSNAVDVWSELELEKPRPAPDEKAIEDVRNLLKDLKTKLDQF